jgi:putative oxidoreductase
VTLELAGRLPLLNKRGGPPNGDGQMERAMNQIWTDRALSVLRIVTALVFFEHGTTKFFNLPPSPYPPMHGLFTLFGGSAILELVGGFLLLIGLFTRPVAFILAGEMAVAYFLVHAPKSFFPVLNGGDSAIQFCFVFLFLVFAGGGPWSVDARLHKWFKSA